MIIETFVSGIAGVVVGSVIVVVANVVWRHFFGDC